MYREYLRICYKDRVPITSAIARWTIKGSERRNNRNKKNNKHPKGKKEKKGRKKIEEKKGIEAIGQ